MQLFATLFASVMIALAMPELPPETLAELQVIESNAESVAMASEGISVYDNATSSALANIALFGSLYRGLQAWNQWQGGDDYIINRQYVVDRTDLPEWLADYAGDVIFWELEYFGHTVEMLTDKDGKLLIDNAEESTTKAGRAVNVRIKNEMIQAVQKYKVENPNKNNARVVQSFVKPSVYMGELKPPYLDGDDLHIFTYQNASVHHFIFKNFVDQIISIYTYPYSGVYSILYYKVGGQNTDGMQVYKDGNLVSLSTINGDGRWSYNGTHGYFTISKYFKFDIGLYGDTVSINYPASYKNFNIGSSNYNNVNNNNYSGVYHNQLYANSPIGDIFVTRTQIKEVTQNSVLQDISDTEISADSLQDIVDAIAEIEPEIDPETGIEILPLPEEFPEPEPAPLEPEPEPVPEDPIGPGIEDFPESDPEQVPEYDPDIDPAIEPTSEELPDSESAIPLQQNLSIVTGLQNRFPFSIPWDIYNALSMLNAERETPHWEWLMQIDLPNGETFEYNFVLDLEFMASVAKLFRDLFLLSFILGLAVFSYNKFFGGGA